MRKNPVPVPASSKCNPVVAYSSIITLNVLSEVWELSHPGCVVLIVMITNSDRNFGLVNNISQGESESDWLCRLFYRFIYAFLQVLEFIDHNKVRFLFTRLIFCFIYIYSLYLCFIIHRLFISERAVASLSWCEYIWRSHWNGHNRSDLGVYKP